MQMYANLSSYGYFGVHRTLAANKPKDIYGAGKLMRNENINFWSILSPCFA